MRIDDPRLSRHLARLLHDGSSLVIEDLGSTNGTLVNANPVKKHILHTHDVIEIGKYKLKFVSEAPTGQASVADFEKTMVLRPPAAKTAMASG